MVSNIDCIFCGGGGGVYGKREIDGFSRGGKGQSFFLIRFSFHFLLILK